MVNQAGTSEFIIGVRCLDKISGQIVMIAGFTSYIKPVNRNQTTLSSQ